MKLIFAIRNSDSGYIRSGTQFCYLKNRHSAFLAKCDSRNISWWLCENYREAVGSNMSPTVSKK